MKKSKGWYEKSRKHKKTVWMEIKNRIKDDNHTKSDLFSSHDYIHDNIQWIDIMFLGKNKVVYNACIMTAKYDYYEKMRMEAWDKLDKLLDENDTRVIYATDKLFRPIQRANTYAKDEKIPCLGNLTDDEYFEQEKENITNDKIVKVFEHITKDKSYSYGIGLEVVLDVDALTVVTLEEFIKSFRDNYENDFKSKELLHFDYETIKDLGMFSANRIILDDSIELEDEL